MKAPTSITIREVSPRDGLQGEPVEIGTEAKIDLINQLADAGLPRINVTSFVSPKAVPRMADAAEVVAGVVRRPGLELDASVPNVRGAERAIAAGIDTVVVFVAASNEGNLRNVGRSTEESMVETSEVIRMVRSAGKKAVGTVALAFGSPYGDEIPPDRVVELAGRFVAAGANGISLGDTTGEANPRAVHELVRRLHTEYPGVELALHLHDTRGLALANVLAGMDAGATHFDGAVGGIGGSPFTKDAGGNLATEDLLYMCASMGVQTGVDLDAVLGTYQFLEKVLGHPLPGKLGQLGRSDPRSQEEPA
ncbi:MAG: hydroxymethylglutaryl-CoA lyase [Marmoricola sp.]|nr:hydroxymethylglutaryl-CoA lyase [Marmoricola sp.]